MQFFKKVYAFANPLIGLVSSCCHSIQVRNAWNVGVDCPIREIKIKDSNFRSLHSLPESEDVLFAVLSDRVLSDKRRRALAKCELHEVCPFAENLAYVFLQFFLTSSTDIAICELFAKLAARLRAIPALFAVVEEVCVE